MKCSHYIYPVLVAIFILSACSKKTTEQKNEVNYDESKVPAYTLPDPLILSSGEKVKTIEVWESRRRPEILALFKSEMYGKFPPGKVRVSFEPLEESREALDGTAIRKQVRAHFPATAGICTWTY